jgi:HlyD family secretion protein
LKTRWVVGAFVIVAGVAGGAYFEKAKSAGPKFSLQTVERGTVVATVTAAGTLSAVTTVKVGSQVSGIVARLGVDFNARVKKGQLLAELDPSPFQAALAQAEANLQKAKVDLHAAQLSYNRQKKLLDIQLIAQSDFDTSTATRDDAAAAVAQQEAAVQQARTNLIYTKITSPIDGVVVDRQYDIGQTVAASFQAPTLFTIAQDLTKMQVLTNLDEADIGGVKVGQPATFSVDAYPDATFQGTVSQIRLSTQTVQNVVTYPVVVDVSNLDGKLMPGMTASVNIPIAARKDVLRVPNAALRFRPEPADVVGGADAMAVGRKRAVAGGGKAGATGAAGGGATGAGAAAASGEAGAPSGGAPSGARAAAGSHPGAGRPASGGHQGIVYVLAAGGKLNPISVHTSITDGSFTAVDSGQLAPGTQVVVGLATAQAGQAGKPGANGPARGLRM